MSKSPSLRRIQADIRELALDPSDRYHAAPLETDMFEWHFTIRGADDTDFAGGVYHGRIMLPPEYPFKPPHIIFLTPSGRFETNTKVCLSFSAYHPELWQPAWGIRLILEALISFLPTPADGAIGALDWTSAERKRLAKKSLEYHCPTCGCKAVDLLPELKPKSENDSEKPKSKFQKEIEKLQLLQNAQHAEKTEQNETKDEKDKKSEEEASKKDESESEPQLKEEVKEQPKQEESAKAEEPAKTEAPKPSPASTETAAASPAPPQPAPPAAAVQQNTQQPPREEYIIPVQAPAHENLQQINADAGFGSWMVDPILHGIIVVLAVLCLLLWRKLQDMIEELEQLNEVLEA